MKLPAFVSILVLLETALIQTTYSAQAIKSAVSILVLLETALIRYPLLFFVKLKIQFQSLFYWKLLSYLMSVQSVAIKYLGFNPCFIGNCSHTLSKNKEKKVNREKCFNPCFIGNCSHTCTRNQKWYGGLPIVSILVLLETALILNYLKILSYPLITFQSLFYWKLLSYRAEGGLL